MRTKERFIEELKQYAKKETMDDLLERGEEVYPDDFAGGNIDDAYNSGFNHGQTMLAREVLYFLN